MKKEIVNVDLVNYEGIVKALYSKDQEIEWNYYTWRDSQIYPSAVQLCDTPDFLVEMGFRDKFVYDRKHLLAANQERMEGHWKDNKNNKPTHSHGASEADMLKLPRMLEKPLAIMTSSKVREDSSGNKYSTINLLYAERKNCKNEFHMVVIEPDYFHNGILNQYNASKVISTYPITEYQVHEKLNSTLQGQRELLYFDAEGYKKLRFKDRSEELIQQGSCQKTIQGKFHPRDNATRFRMFFERNLTKAINDEIKRMNHHWYEVREGDSTYPPLKMLYNKMIGSKTMDEALEYRSILKDIANKSSNIKERAYFESKLDIDFAKTYLKMMTIDDRELIVKNYSDIANRMEINCSEDFDYMCMEIDKLLESAPTLKDRGVVLSSDVHDNKYVSMAYRASSKLEHELVDAMTEITERKILEYEERTKEQERIR